MIYVGFNKRSCVTAKEIKDKISEGGVGCRMINRKNFARKPSVFIRYGNSYKEAPEGVLEINSIESVKNASDKRIMAELLKSKEGVRFPESWWPGDTVEEGGYYFRNRVGKVVFRSRPMEGDLYGTKPVDRAREFRVHVFSDSFIEKIKEKTGETVGNTMGVYEKIPHEENQLYCKNDNCDFKRIDMSNSENSNALKGVRPMARSAVEALGLDFGGVDVIISKDGGIYVNEVNSAPSLNTLNIERFVELIKKYIG